jgi:hypothetical protein
MPLSLCSLLFVADSIGNQNFMLRKLISTNLIFQADNLFRFGTKLDITLTCLMEPFHEMTELSVIKFPRKRLKQLVDFQQRNLNLIPNGACRELHSLVRLSKQVKLGVKIIAT